MRFLAQIRVLMELAARSLPHRIGSSLVIVLSMTCITAVLLSMLSETEGLVLAYGARGDPRDVIVLSAQSLSEFGNAISRDEAGTVLDAPGIARRPDGGLRADPEIVFWIPPTGAYTVGSPELRGIGRGGLAVRPRFRVLSGRMFRPGHRELMVGVRAERAFDLKIGDLMILPDGEWPIVGVFADGGSILEGELLTDADTVMSSSGLNGFSSVLVTLERAGAFARFSRWLTTNPTLLVSAETQSAYAQQTANRLGSFVAKVAYVIASIMSLGALFGAVKIMNASVAARLPETATLRAVGFGSAPVAISVVLETIILSITGAAFGGGLAWLLFDGKLLQTFDTAYSASVSPGLFAVGLAWGFVLALLGGVPPAVRAARISVSRGLLAG